MEQQYRQCLHSECPDIRVILIHRMQLEGRYVFCMNVDIVVHVGPVERLAGQLRHLGQLHDFIVCLVVSQAELTGINRVFFRRAALLVVA